MKFTKKIIIAMSSSFIIISGLVISNNSIKYITKNKLTNSHSEEKAASTQTSEEKTSPTLPATPQPKATTEMASSKPDSEKFCENKVENALYAYAKIGYGVYIKNLSTDKDFEFIDAYDHGDFKLIELQLIEDSKVIVTIDPDDGTIYQSKLLPSTAMQNCQNNEAETNFFVAYSLLNPGMTLTQIHDLRMPLPVHDSTTESHEVYTYQNKGETAKIYVNMNPNGTLDSKKMLKSF